MYIYMIQSGFVHVLKIKMNAQRTRLREQEVALKTPLI